MKNKKLQTQAIRTGYIRSQEQEHSEAIFLTSSFVFDSAEQAKKRFAKEEVGNIYARFTNPTVATFEKRLAALEGAKQCVATATGMAAIFATVMALCKSGDHIVVSKSVFGTTLVLLNDIVAKYGIEISWVDLIDLNDWQKNIKKNTKLFLLETPSNPMLDVVDIEKLSEIAHTKNILLAIDNCFLTPFGQQPLKLGADIIIHSATKYIDGQGRCLGGAVLGSEDLMNEISLFVRNTGPTMSAFNAWILLKGLETLSLRFREHCANALKLATWLEKQPQIEKVYYLGLVNNKHHSLAKQQQTAFGGIVSFVVKGGQKSAWEVIDKTQFLSITANLGDTKTTITHPATTTHSRLSEEERQEAGIVDGLIRVSVGLENIDDIIADIHLV
ncbi:O-acetylhomoserine sulfhydrylase / O-succinylhomoserine sulfhydrylase [hydrothermal vent metagenome]|uniref:O-acetylhomoserine sulfhydrylase / O-succinylhomoserine sulfhydrylase n=1 Tax=hydrothermal vent metagenome TaxID=652676 RepID=A0A1W1CSK0_9ZZZZ